MGVKRGRCLCGAVTYEYEGDENWRGYCHCESCRRNTSAPVTAFFGVDYEKFKFTGDEPGVYQSSPGVKRSFCRTCGTPMAYETERLPHEIHLYAASLENPEDYTPAFHVFHAEHLPWLSIEDDLPRHAKFSSG